MADIIEPARTRAPDYTAATPAEDARTELLNRVSWGAVLAGVAIALVLQFLLSLLGVGIGAATLHPGTGNNPDASTFSIVSAVWYGITGLISAFVGGFVAARLSGKSLPGTGGLHGLTTWAVTMLLLLYLLTTTIGGLVGGAFSTLATVAGGVGGTVATAAQTAAPALAGAADPFAAIQQKLTQASGGNDPATLRDAAIAAVKAAVTGDQAQATQATDVAAQAVAKAQNIPVDQAGLEVQQYVKQYQDALKSAQQRAVQAADAAAGGTAKGAIAAFIVLVISAAAAWFGGRLGTAAPILTGDRRLRHS